MVDYSTAIPMYVPLENVFIDQNRPRWVVIHKTATPDCRSAQQVATSFVSDTQRRSAHYVVGMDGAIVQCVAEKDGAGANCCLEVGHDSFWPTNINLNLVTISIEHVDPTSDNSTPVTAAQQQASFALVADICKRHGIAAANIVGHHSLDPISRARCPGNYPLDELKQYVAGGTSMNSIIPTGWTDDGTTLTAPNGVIVVKGFRAKVHQGWDAKNLPLEKERTITPVEQADPSSGSGTIQTFMQCRLAWTEARGVYTVPIGAELLFAEKQEMVKSS